MALEVTAGTLVLITYVAFIADKLFQQVLLGSVHIGRIAQAGGYHQAVFVPRGETLQPEVEYPSSFSAQFCWQVAIARITLEFLGKFHQNHPPPQPIGIICNDRGMVPSDNKLVGGRKAYGCFSIGKPSGDRVPTCQVFNTGIV